MKTGFQGTFVIPWSQTETDGVRGARLYTLSVGVIWRWSRGPVRVVGPQDVLVLAEAEGIGELHRRAARMVQRLTGIKASKLADKAGPDLPQQSIAVTDGHHFHVITGVAAPGTGALLLTVTGLPPPDCDLGVVRLGLGRAIIWANGLETESLHTAAVMRDPQQRTDLSYVLVDPQACGKPARCSLSTAAVCNPAA